MTTYKESGVDVEAGEAAVRAIRERMKKTFRFGEKIQEGPGGYAAFTQLAYGPMVGLSADGVGTKLKIAIALNKHDTVGQDLVAMSVNDLAVAGFRPQLFMDYMAMGKQRVERTDTVIGGIIDACEEVEVALMGGEMAEMPGMYREDDYDLAGFAVGFCGPLDEYDGRGLMWPNGVQIGMTVWGYPSTGLHSNGYSLVRSVFGISSEDDASARAALHISYPEFGMLGDELLKPTALYPSVLRRVRTKRRIVSCAHITGGGLKRNVPRALPWGKHALIDHASWQRHPIFSVLQEKGDLTEDEMLSTFNCGIGLVAIAEDDLSAEGFVAIGEIKAGEKGVTFK